MRPKIIIAIMALGASWLVIAGSGCAPSPATPIASSAQPAALRLEQPAMTDYMRSRVGTPEELSPIAPAEARNIHKIGDQWVCDVNGKTMVYNNATACWEPKP